jgi:tetratricopeptide (TPR) repeat protein
MSRWLAVVVLLGLAPTAQPAPFERYLSADRPEDRAIMAYMELDASGKATSMDLTEMAVLLVNKGFSHDAEDYLKAALKKDKHNFEAAYRLGLVLQRQGHYYRACHWYRRTLKERPGHGPARFMLALAQERAGRRWASINNYKRAYRHAPDLADPAKNPLVLESRLQTEALIKTYQEKSGKATHHVLPVDALAVQRMSLAVPVLAQGQAMEAPAPAAPAAKAPAAATNPKAAKAAPQAPSTPPPVKETPTPGKESAAAPTHKQSKGLHAAPVVVPPAANVSGAP